MSDIGMIMIGVPMRDSMALSSRRFSFSRKVAVSTGRCTCTAAVFSFIACSWTMRSTESAEDWTLRTCPVPSQRGQTRLEDSPSEGRSRWRDISSSPKREIRPTCTRARSTLSASIRRNSTSRRLRSGDMSMKSMTIRPPRSRSRNWRATSSAASTLVLSAVSSMSAPLVARAEFTSIVTRASVLSNTTAPPEGRRTSRENADSIWCSIWKRENNGTSSW